MKISIALCTFNGERFLQEQLDSLAAQTRLPDEVVVGDDGSTDRTLEILEACFRYGSKEMNALLDREKTLRPRSCGVPAMLFLCAIRMMSGFRKKSNT